MKTDTRNYFGSSSRFPFHSMWAALRNQKAFSARRSFCRCVHHLKSVSLQKYSFYRKIQLPVQRVCKEQLQTETNFDLSLCPFYATWKAHRWQLVWRPEAHARSEVEPPRDSFDYAGLKRSRWKMSCLYRHTIKYTNNLNCKLSPACPFKVLLQLKSIQPVMCFLRPRTLHWGLQACWSLVRLSWGEGRVHPGQVARLRQFGWLKTVPWFCTFQVPKPEAIFTPPWPILD